MTSYLVLVRCYCADIPVGVFATHPEAAAHAYRLRVEDVQAAEESLADPLEGGSLDPRDLYTIDVVEFTEGVAPKRLSSEPFFPRAVSIGGGELVAKLVCTGTVEITCDGFKDIPDIGG